MNQKMHTVRLIRPFNHGGELFQGQCELTDAQFLRAERFGLIDGKPGAGAKPDATRTDTDTDTDTDSDDDADSDKETQIIAAVTTLAEETPGKKPNVKDVEKKLGFDINAAERDAAWATVQESAESSENETE